MTDEGPPVARCNKCGRKLTAATGEMWWCEEDGLVIDVKPYPNPLLWLVDEALRHAEKESV